VHKETQADHTVKEIPRRNTNRLTAFSK
jgi:hypothetical protein